MHPHYERIICLCCFLMFFVNVGLPSTSFNTFQPYLAALPHVGNTGGSSIIFVRTLVSLVCVFFVDRYVTALGTRYAAALATLFTGLGFLLFSFAKTLWGLYLGAAFAGAGYGLGGMVLVTLITRRWFATNVATAVGIATMGSGISSFLLPTPVARIIENVSLGWGFRFEAILALVVALLLFLLLRDDPCELGLQAYHNPNEAKARKSAHKAAETPLPHKANFLLLAGVVCLAAVAVNGYNCISILFITEGMDSLHAATLISLMGFMLAFGKFCSGILIDRIGTFRSTLILFTTMAAGLVCACLSAAHPLFPYLCVLLFGFGVTLGSLAISIWSMEFATPENMTATVKNLQVAYALGSFLFSLVPGLLMDVFGSYVYSYVIMLGLSLASAVLIEGVYLRYKAKPQKARKAYESKNTWPRSTSMR